ncbi:DUF2975 domain-containing protein [Microtetraspora sp. NBRC 16547]|uniref:DUF2975 domain-containing protein n=1 Tax=Microtetraspora sp. NBRC 16547 TaxID=3030993 RepID=UPI0024A0F2D5|nr:DUF2975 domain-containing protein [Microtetraspora sp. NBRC 16547]GLX02694.1 hypothetical protein Misp02_67800 [Microtetraspora sp. NBRC 16547]
MSLDRPTLLKRTAIAVRLLLVLFAAMTVYEVGRAALTGGENAFGSRGAQSLVCVASPGIGAVKGNIFENPQRMKALAASSTIDDNPYPVRSGVEFAHPLPRICKDDSSFGTQLLYQTSRFATPLMLLVALFLLDRLIGRARRESGFDEVVVARLRFLGAFLIIGAVAASLYAAVVETGLAVSMVAGSVRRVWEMALFGWDVPWASVLAGLGFVVMSKVVRVGAHMREELEGTV